MEFIVLSFGSFELRTVKFRESFIDLFKRNLFFIGHQFQSFEELIEIDLLLAFGLDFAENDVGTGWMKLGINQFGVFEYFDEVRALEIAVFFAIGLEHIF